MSGDLDRPAAGAAADMRMVASEVPKPEAAPSTWRTWVLLLEPSDAEAWPATPVLERDGDRTAF